MTQRASNRLCFVVVRAEGNDYDHIAQDPRIRQALALLSADQLVDFGELASKLNLSGSRLRHLFKKELGVSPRRYLRLMRMKQAKALLESSFLSVKEIAARVGINDISHFGREYKLLYGQTPNQTRWHFRDGGP